VTFDREPDLDNANVGMPDTRILGRTKYIKEVTKSVASFFVFGGVYMVKINGKELNIAGKTVAEYLATTNYDPKRIAVERNGDIVPKAQYGETVLKEGDSVEVVSFVGGG
jgi:sulfur carrier protein